MVGVLGDQRSHLGVYMKSKNMMFPEPLNISAYICILVDSRGNLNIELDIYDITCSYSEAISRIIFSQVYSINNVISYVSNWYIWIEYNGYSEKNPNFKNRYSSDDLNELNGRNI
ncbi:hypothetical protein RCL_jg695.t1 [Rhizophagus clarus]|uniref:Uncharacterized protein n=1 Tax=Rhizophagus clarus TaxID=94130 RepID=A0A8H3QLS3_9GLOM|nr:hypothetical protein RCL_jg695.t1 [Rhizophagus clarus]